MTAYPYPVALECIEEQKMIKASELRTKYFNEDIDLKDLDFHKSIIEEKKLSVPLKMVKMILL